MTGTRALVVPAHRRRHARVWDASPARIAGRTIAGIVIAVVFLIPYLIMLVGSFKSRNNILAVPPTYLPTTWHPENYLTMWSTPETPCR
ncbi:hypothetical protein [Microbacterium elymi]|uniref:Carbohydrate ABC transporter permease n=1 Tax=Microbacterium elymi TaxID=2909587 RepID=A0ABY5NHS5_9MICO|nr:hypothetical protein [Microbacterium elymi]UUT34738.1 hypothetical protein L2X98_30240 [Microbacterium elymi]